MGFRRLLLRKESRVKRLHIGAFDQPAPGWYNTDITPHLFIARMPLLPMLMHRVGALDDQRFLQHQSGVFRQLHYLNVRRPLRLSANSVEAVFSSHVLEHIAFEDALRLLREVRRVLQPGGVVRTSVPDLDRIVADFVPEEADKTAWMIFESRGRKDKNAHRWLYNAHSLTALLREAGFEEVRRCEYRTGRCPDIDFLDNRPEQSVFVEATK